MISLFISLLFTSNAFSQTVEDGKRFLYYERYKSAEEVLTKLVNDNPNNADAVYWLGQTYIATDDSISAKILYHKTLSANPNAYIVSAGLGHIALMENNINQATFRFEIAYGRTKGKDANVINAIAKGNIHTRIGNAVYAIEILKSIPRDKMTAEMWTTLGDAYRKLADGTNAQLSYENALLADPLYARASFMIGRIYQTQGIKQERIYMKYYNDAISIDPKYAPVYYWLYSYYYDRDVNKSRTYLDQYIAVADADVKSCYYQASILYASGQFKEAINRSDECIAAAGQDPYLKLYGLKAFAYEKLGDSINANTFFKMYFEKQRPENLLSGDYATYAKVLLKLPGNEESVAGYFEKAVMLDTLKEKKIEYITSAAHNYMTAKKYAEAANWYMKLFDIKKQVTKTDLYNAGINYFRAEKYNNADSLFKLYKQKYPDDILGYYYGAITSANIDSTSVLGLALPDYEKVIAMAPTSVDTARAKQLLIMAYNYMLNYYFTIKKDKATATGYNDKILALDPTNARALANDKVLRFGDEKVKVENNKPRPRTD